MGKEKNTSSEVASEDSVKCVLHVKNNTKDIGSSYRVCVVVCKQLSAVKYKKVVFRLCGLKHYNIASGGQHKCSSFGFLGIAHKCWRASFYPALFCSIPLEKKS